jgi:hypothetical protein
VVYQTSAPIFPSYYTDGSDPCLLTSKSNDSSDWFNWQLVDDSIITINTTGSPFCATQMVRPTLSDSIMSTPYSTGYKYNIGGVPVYYTAIGAPYWAGEGFGASFGSWGLEFGDGQDFLWSSQCFPIMTNNPVQCRVAGNVTVSQNEVTVSAGNCSVTTPVFTVDPTTQGASAAGACTAGLDVGRATILIGSVNDHATMLASTMNDTTYISSRKAYAISCSVDIAPSISFRSLNYSIANAADFGGADRAGFRVAGDSTQPCEPSIALSQILTNTTLAIAAAASYQLLAENRYLDGWWSTLYHSAGWSHDYKFNNSRYPIEEALGLASGIAYGTYLGTKTPDGIDSEVNYDGQTALNGVRVGSGKWWAMFYILPSVFSIILLVTLLTTNRKLNKG